MRKRFLLTLAQEKMLERATDATVAMTNLRTGEVPMPNPVSKAWDELGREYGFDPDTVKFDLVDESITAEVTK